MYLLERIFALRALIAAAILTVYLLCNRARWQEVSSGVAFVEVLRSGEIQVGHISKKFGAIAGIDLLPGGCNLGTRGKDSDWGAAWGKSSPAHVIFTRKLQVRSFLSFAIHIGFR